jgi:branched-chain amino acid transport system substrate-binding protein
VKYGVADSEAKPNTAVQNGSRFISDNKAVLLAGSVSSAEAVAMNKLAQREKVIYLPCISGSNDTTGKDCVRYGFRECFYGQTAANAISPVLIKALGKNKKVAYLTPDYTYGHTVHASMEQFTKPGGWTTVTNQVSPLGTADYSSYLLNVANSGAEVLVNINFGNDAVLSIKQAKQFGILDKMTLAMPYNTPFLAKEVGPETMQGVYAATDYWWTLEDKYPLAKLFNEAFRAKYKYNPEWGAEAAYMQIALWADAVERAKSFYPPDVIKAYEAAPTLQSVVGEVKFRAADHQLIRPVVIVRGKKVADMKSADDYYEIVEVVPGEPLMQAPEAVGCTLVDYT